MRKKGLDILRAIAVMLVLCRHNNLNGNILEFFGWLGVDLFFVLSGFLVSGLLFKECQKTNAVNIKRFISRRAFKIFPPFYFFLATTLLVKYFYNGTGYKIKEVLCEIFYLQNYIAHIWNHTWTLAVEEHFYFLFAMSMFVLVKRELISRKSFIISSLVGLLVLSFMMRFDFSYTQRCADFVGFTYTHLRSDGILIGVLFSYLHYFTNVTSELLKRKWITLLAGSILILPGFYYAGGSFYMNTIGLTSVNLGFALFVLLSLDIEKYLDNGYLNFLKIPVSILTFIGINSYSIYLWHLNSKKFVYWYFDYNSKVMIVLSMSLSIILGIFMSYLIEKTFLKIRDKYTS